MFNSSSSTGSKMPDDSRLHRFFRKTWWIALVVVALGVIGFLIYDNVTTKRRLDKLADPQSVVQAEKQQLLREIGQNFVLPKEEPTLATVSDAAKLKDQDFFANAKDGDKVLIFSKAGRALLYRPSIDKVIEYAKVDLGGSANPEP